MPYLTRKQAAALGLVLDDLEQVKKYLDTREVCIPGGVPTTILHYTRADGSVLYPVEKWIGSELARLPTAIARLRNFLMLQEHQARR